MDDKRIAQVIDDLFIDELETAINDRLLEHYRVVRHIVPSTEKGFTSLGFAWQPVKADDLVFCAERDAADRFAPGRMKRLLVRCYPFRAVLRQAVEEAAHLCGAVEPRCHDAVLVHSLLAYQPNRRELNSGVVPPVYICHPDEISEIEW